MIFFIIDPYVILINLNNDLNHKIRDLKSIINKYESKLRKLIVAKYQERRGCAGYRVGRPHEINVRKTKEHQL